MQDVLGSELNNLPLAAVREGWDQLQRMLLFVARGMFLLGLVAVSIMVARVGSFTVGDGLIMGAIIPILMLPPRVWLPRMQSLRLADVSLFFLVLGAGLATMVSVDEKGSFLVLVRLVILATILPWQASVLFSRGRYARMMFSAYGIGCGLNGIATILQMAFHVNIPGSQISSADRYSGLTANVSDTGAICGLGVVIGFGLLGRGSWRRADVLAGFIMMFSLVGVILSGSVSGMISAALGAVVILTMRGVAGAKVRTAALVTVLGAVGGFWLISLTSNGLSPVQRLMQVLGFSAKYAGTNTSASRLVTIQRGWISFAHHPWTGIGLNISSSTVYDDLPVHNLPVALLHVGGFFFAAGVLGIVCARVGALLLVRRIAAWAPLALGCMVATFWFAMTAPGYYNRYFWVPVAMCGYVALTARDACEKDSPSAAGN